MARQDGNPAMKTSRSRCLPGVSLAGALARKLANPVASLISVPLQYNYDENIGLDDKGSKSVLNVQPVIPLSLSQDWNLIIRTIVPLIDQQDVSARGESESGMGDITQSFFFSPKAPVGGWILAAGPVGYYRSATDTQLGAEKWGAGPTALALKQTGPWTVGMLTNHIESFAGDDDRAEVLLRAQRAGVRRLIVTGASAAGSHAARDLAHAHPGVLYATAGTNALVEVRTAA